MTASNFQNSLKYVLASEGGNDDNPLDHGGRTSRGITQAEYNAWRDEHSKPRLDVWQAPQDDIDTIYHDEYWGSVCDLLPIGVDYLYFDLAVNGGPNRAAIILQKAVGVTADGRIGPITREAIKRANPRILLENFTTIKREWYYSLHQPAFIKGWINRTNQVHDNALAMMKG